jgi:uncharacterized damage-inducible protein DinB
MSTHLEQYKAFARYNQTFNQRVFEVAGSLSEEERKADRGAFFKSIHATLNHILLADRIWLARFRDAGFGTAALQDAELLDRFQGLDQELYADFAVLRQERAATDDTIVRWVVFLSDSDLGAPMIYKTSKGIERRHPAWVAMTHLFNHQTHHRGQVTTLFSQQGLDVGVTDFLVLAGV